MQTAGLSDRELVPSFVVVAGGGVGRSRFSHDIISEPRSSDHLRFSLADLTALLATSVPALSSTNFLNCQEWKSKQNNYNEMMRSMNTHIVI
jgi:hypothetical protein